MATTPDLPPGARFRMWALFIFTLIVGIGTYWAFERVEGLLVAGGVLLILLYLLAGVALTLKRDKKEIGPLVALSVESMTEPFWALLDGRQGTVLYLSDDGVAAFRHSREILLGQRFTDLVQDSSAEAKVRVSEMFRFGVAGNPWSGSLEMKTEKGDVIKLPSKIVVLQCKEGRQAGFIAIGPN